VSSQSAKKKAKFQSASVPTNEFLRDAENQKRLATAIDRYYSQATNFALSHVPVTIELIIPHRIPDINLYLATTDEEERPSYKIFRSRGMYFSQSEVDTLRTNGVKHLYIDRTEVPSFTQYIESVLGEISDHSPMVDEQKITMLRQDAVNVLTDIFLAPTAENIQRGVKVVSGFVYVLMRDPKAYQLLLSLSSHDHYTLQHSVGVATNSIILAKKIGINDEASLIEVGVGGLLHDIGKTRVPKEIINKNGPLDESEWAIMKQHALFGYEILKDNPNVGVRAKLAVLQHHEDPSGSGYPMGLSGSQIDLFAKIVAIADIYNAITTDRAYSKAKPPFEAFQLIKAKLSHRVDMKLFESLVLIYGGGNL